MPVSIADVAEATVTVETCAPRTARFPDGVVRERAKNPFLGWETVPVALHMYRIRNVVLDRSLMVLLKDGAVIAETVYEQAPDAVAAVRVRPEHLVVADLGNAVAACCDHWDANYYHWVAHTLPALHAMLERHPRGDIGLLVPRLAPWQRLWLDLIGAGGLASVTTHLDAQYFLPEVEYYDFVGGRADFALSAVSRAAYARIGADVPAGDSPHRLIYIDRSGAANRRLRNEAGLAERLRRRGFHTVRPETLRVDQQIALFRGAGMVVGQVGAGLANIAFCRPGTVVYELVPDHHRNPCFVAMAMQGDLQYWADVFPTGVTDGDHTSAWRTDIDVDGVMRRIDELAALIPSGRRPAQKAPG
jgi:capsular polysaccharide biosynthesis protein